MKASEIAGGSPANLHTYENREVAEHYAALDYLTPCERLLFETHISPGSAILDLGVGGGRTTGYLAGRASRYVGVDYAAAMVDACRNRFPSLEFTVADAADLRAFPNASLDVVVFSFNGIDMLHSDARRSCLGHIHRILKPGGRLIFSSHNPRAVVILRSWNRERIRQIAKHWSFGSEILKWLVWVTLAPLRGLLAFFQTLGATALRILARVPSRMFWCGEGTRMDSAHGGLMTHYSLPRHVLKEVTAFGFRPVRVLGDDYPRSSHILTTDWYYYVFTKSCEK